MSGKGGDWISVAVDLPRHPRFLDFICELDIDEVTGLGLLVKFWSTVFRMMPDGNLSGKEPRTIARMTGWRKRPDEMYAALKTAGFIDGNECVHDWKSWGGRLYYSRKKGAEQKAAKREEQAQCPPDILRTSCGRPADVRGMSSKTHRVKSKEEIKIKNLSSEKVSAPTDEDWTKRANAVLETTHFPTEYKDLASILAAENKTGKVALSRVVRVLYEPLLAFENNGTTPEKLLYGLRTALEKGVPNANYVKKAAKSAPDGYSGRSNVVDDGSDVWA